MYFLKGFVELAGFASNVPGKVSLIGELSSISSTYSKEKGFYSDVNYPDLNLVSFSSKDNEVLIEIPAATKTSVFKVLGWIYSQMVSTANLEDRTGFLNFMIDTFASEIEEVACGQIVSENGIHAPDWISWKLIGSDSYIRIWFSDPSFQLQFDEYEITVVPPINNLDNFFRAGNEVEALMNAVNVGTMVDRLQVAKNNFPETIILVESYNYIDPANSGHKVPTRWGVLIYGAAGNNTDSIKDALIKFILANTTHTRAEWTEILPDLFKRTEFILTPVWDQYAIPNRVLESGIYSPILPISKALSIAKQTAVDYPAAHVERYLTILGHPYKSLVMTVLGGPENREGKFLITDFYPDIISVSSTGTDFNRLAPATQELLNILAEMIVQAETVSRYTVLPFGMTRLIRNDILYVVKTLNNVQFLIVAKNNFS